jgi:hypothetical protein
MGSVAFLSPDIPTKIYLAIAEHFLLSPIVALTLASKRLAHVYGIKVRDNLRVDRHERRDVFLLLERDLPGYYLAYAEDAKLTQQLAFYAYLKFSSEQSWLRSGSIDLHRFDYELAWYRLLRALKRGMCGHEPCLPLDEFKHSKSHSVLAENIGYQIDLSAEAKIVGGRVLLRSTHNITNETTMTYTELQNLKSAYVVTSAPITAGGPGTTTASRTSSVRRGSPSGTTMTTITTATMLPISKSFLILLRRRIYSAAAVASA